MKRVYLAALTAMLLLTGCGSRAKYQEPAVSLPDNAAEGSAFPETETEFQVEDRPIAERAAEMQAAGERRVFDEQGVLEDAERQQFTEYLDRLSGSRQMQTGVVVTNQLSGETPEQFAQDYFEALFGERAHGFLLLINNDTDHDFIYATSDCAPFIDASLAMAQATPHLVERRYAQGIELLLPVGEMVPDRVMDRANALTPEEVQQLCERANALDSRYTVLLTELSDMSAQTETPETEAASAEDTSTEETADNPEETAAPTEALRAASDVLQTFADTARTQNEADVLLVIDTASGTCALSGSSNTNLRDGIQAALQGSGVYAAVGYYYDCVS